MIFLPLAACTGALIPVGSYACQGNQDCTAGFSCVGAVCVAANGAVTTSGTTTTAGTTGSSTTGATSGAAGTTHGAATTSGATVSGTTGSHSTASGTTTGPPLPTTSSTASGTTGSSGSGSGSGSGNSGSGGVASCESTYTAAVLADSPAVYYHFDEPAGATTLIDSSGNGQNGSYAAPVILGVPGAEGTALQIGGDGGYATYTPVTDISGTFSVEAWVNVAGCTDGPIATTRVGDGVNWYEFDLQTNRGLCDGGAHGDIGTGVFGTWLTTYADAPNPLPAGQWTQLVYVVTPTETFIYQDGAFVADAGYSEGSGTPILWDTSHQLQIGSALSQSVNGAIDELSFYATALSADRIAAHYAAASSCPVASVAAGQLLNLDYGVNAAGGAVESMTGPAAIGAGPNDVWNPIGVTYNGPTANDYSLGPLLWADGTASAVNVESINLPGAWGITPANGSAMLKDFQYSFSGATAQVELTGLPAGSYALYVYDDTGGGNSAYAVNVYAANSTVIESLPAVAASGVDSPSWIEGGQYVVRGDVCVAAGQKLELAISNGTQGAGNSGCQLNGLQVLQTGAGACTQLDAGLTEISLAPSPGGYVGALTEDVQNLYWIDYNQSVYRMPKTGGTPVVIASGLSGAGSALAVDSDYAYWTEGTAGTIRKAPLDGGLPITLASGQDSPTGLTIDSTNVYWVNRVAGGAVAQASKVDGSNLLVLADGGNLPYYVAVDGQNVYWTTLNAPSGQPGNGSVNQVAIGGGPATMLTNIGEPSDLVLDANNIYFGDWGNFTCCNWASLIGIGNIWKLPKGSTTPILLASGQAQPQYLAVDSQNVYWSNYRNGSIASVSLDGGGADTLDSWGFCLQGLTVDATGLYFSPCSGSNNALVVIAPP